MRVNLAKTVKRWKIRTDGKNAMKNKGSFKNLKLGKNVNRQIKRRGATEPLPAKRSLPGSDRQVRRGKAEKGTGA
jgi:hypothetical protein